MPYMYRRRTSTWNIHGIYRLYTSLGFQMYVLDTYLGRKVVRTMFVPVHTHTTPTHTYHAVISGTIVLAAITSLLPTLVGRFAV
jgi:hypothetical protein